MCMMCTNTIHNKWIGVFKTNVQYRRQVRQLQPVLNSTAKVLKWNFDLGDCDKILRVESRVNIAGDIIDMLLNNGFNCEELE